MRDRFGRFRGVMMVSPAPATSDVTESVRGSDETSFPLWFESEPMLLLNSVTLFF